MDEIDALRRYAARSAAAAPPKIDVAADVLRTIRQTPQTRDRWSSFVRPFAGVAAAGWLLTFSLGIMLLQSLAELQDPLSSLISQFVVNFQ